jgi:hypothetical protein
MFTFIMPKSGGHTNLLGQDPDLMWLNCSAFGFDFAAAAADESSNTGLSIE